MPLAALTFAVLSCVQDPSPSPPPRHEPSPVPAPVEPAGVEARTAKVEAAARELDRLRRGAERPADDVLAAAAATLQVAVEAIVKEPEGLAWDHLARCIRVLWETQQVAACARVCELALERHEPTAELYTQLGMCKLAWAQESTNGAAMRRLGAESAAAFRASAALGEREPAVVLLPQALLVAGENVAALAAFDALLAHPRFAAAAGSRHTGRAVFCLLAGEYAAAVRELETARTAGEEIDADDEMLLVRALVLAGRGEDAVVAARAQWERRKDDVATALLADALGCTGAVDEALELLRANPPDTARMTEDERSRTLRSREVFAYLLELRGKRPGDLREQLRARLRHEPKLRGIDSIRVIDPSLPEDEREGADLNRSPLALGHHLLQVPIDECAWANDALFVVCVEDVARWEVGPFERQLVAVLVKENRPALLGDEALANARAALATQLMMPYAEGILTATRLLDAK